MTQEKELRSYPKVEHLLCIGSQFLSGMFFADLHPKDSVLTLFFHIMTAIVDFSQQADWLVLQDYQGH